MSTDSGLSWQVRKQTTKTMSLVPMPIDKANDHTSPMFASESIYTREVSIKFIP